MGLQATIRQMEMGTLPPAWRRHHGRVSKDSPPDAPWQLRRGLQLSPSWWLLSLSQPCALLWVDCLLSKVEGGAVA